MLPGDSIGLLPGSRNVKYQYVENTFKYLIDGIGDSVMSVLKNEWKHIRRNFHDVSVG